MHGQWSSCQMNIFFHWSLLWFSIGTPLFKLWFMFWHPLKQEFAHLDVEKTTNHRGKRFQPLPPKHSPNTGTTFQKGASCSRCSIRWPCEDGQLVGTSWKCKPRANSLLAHLGLNDEMFIDGSPECLLVLGRLLQHLLVYRLTCHQAEQGGEEEKHLWQQWGLRVRSLRTSPRQLIVTFCPRQMLFRSISYCGWR